MSSTNRGGARDDRDFYPTSRPAFAPWEAMLPKQYAYYDPCCGDYRLVHWMQARGLMADGNDLFPQDNRPAVDFLTDNTPRDFITTNPPFTCALEFADHAIAVANHIGLLLPLNFLGSDERKEWWTAHEPDALFVLSKRPSFAMSVTCKSVIREKDQVRICKHNWMLPIGTPRPKLCPTCGGKELRISTSDSCNYGWFVWHPKGVKLWTGIHHL